MIYSFGIFYSLGISLSIGFGSWKYWACILTSCSLFGMLSFFDPIYRELHQVSNWMRCAWSSFSYLYAHIYVEFVLCILVFLTLWSQWVWVPFCLCCCSRNKWRCIGCSAHSQGRCCYHVLVGVKLGWSMNYFVPSIGIYYILPMLSR